jgi:AcrR family transcriptional regulator
MPEHRSSQRNYSPDPRDKSSGVPTPPRTGLRAELAATTQRVILEAARQLFAEKGYAGVSVKELASEAGVAVQTIYDTFGSKGGVVLRFADVVDEEAGINELRPRILESQDPREVLRLVAQMRRQLEERCGDVVRILVEGAAANPEVGAALAEGMRRRGIGQLAVGQRLEAAGALRPGIDAQRAADIMIALSASQIPDVLVAQRGWSFDEFEIWLSETLATLLLSDGERAGETSSRRHLSSGEVS